MYTFNANGQQIGVNLDDPTDALNIAERLTNDELVEDNEMGLVIQLSEEQPELFI